MPGVSSGDGATSGGNYNRTNNGTPVAAVTPRWVGERVLNTATGVIYISTGLLNTNWSIENASPTRIGGLSE